MEIRKMVSLFLLAAFAALEWSCATSGHTSWGQPRMAAKEIGQIDTKDVSIKIANVVTKEGKNISFGAKSPARFDPGAEAVVGVALQQFVFDKKEIKIYYATKKRILRQIETADGRLYEVLSSLDEGDKVRVNAYAPISIPVSDIQQVWISRSDSGGAVLTFLFVGAAAVAVTALLFGALKQQIDEDLEKFDSCPFVYSFNGEGYVLDAEPFGAAIAEGLKRTDWIELSELQDVAGKYRVLLVNELDETQYTDEFKLVAVDHAPGIKVAADLAGRMYTFVRPLPPIKAFYQKGRDILTFVAGNDRVFWTSRLEEKSADDAEMRDELVFEFPKPATAKRAKLLANVWTTQWGSLSTGMFLEHYGRSLPEKYAEVDRHGPLFFRLMSWMAAEELATLKVWVETPGGWEARSMIMGGAPVITKDKAYVLDVADIPGETLRIRLRPPVNYWMVNSLAVDYSEDTTVSITEIAAEKAVDHTGRDVREVLASTDAACLESPNAGERTELVFLAPPKPEGFERTVFVKASGYYKTHLDATGEPKTELAERILAEPGFAVRYSFREYQKWESALRARLAGRAQ